MLLDPATAFTVTAIALGVAGLGLGTAALSRIVSKQRRVALVDVGDGLRRGRWTQEENVVRVDAAGQTHYFQAAAQQSDLPVETPTGMERWRMFVRGRMGNLEIPLRRHLEFPRAALEDLADRCIAWMPFKPGGPKEPVIDRVHIKQYADARNYDAKLVESALVEIQKAVRGGEADVFTEYSWRKFVLNYKEALGFGAVALMVVGVMLGIQMMTDPYFYAFFTRQDSQWVMVAVLAASVVGITWGTSK